MDDIVVSFCIATFQRYAILEELIMEILSVDSNQFEIVVCDDCSRDDSVEKIKAIRDQRLKIYVNDINVGSLQNIYESLEHGNGRYLFYVNDRDNVDCFKIPKLIDLLGELEKKEVAYIKCINSRQMGSNYQVFKHGKEGILEFACRIDHPTGYIFRRDIWKRMKYRKKLFEKQCYGDYPITMICAMMALKYNGAQIFGDICDVNRERINFAKEKSGYYLKRKDKRVWYSPEVQWRELLIAIKFLRGLYLEETLIEELLYERYKEYLGRVTIQYRDIVSQPYNTLHYNLKVSQNPVVTYMKAIQNGLYVWRKMQSFCKNEKKPELLLKINQSTRIIFNDYFGYIYKETLKSL